mgnify:CR=1 FL=1
MIADGGLYHLVWNGEVLIKQNDKFRNTLPKVIFDKIKMVENEMLLISTKDNGLVEINNKTLKYNVNTKENGLPSNVIKEVLFPGDTPMVVTDLGIAVYNNNYIEPERETPKIVIDTLRLNGEKIQPKNDKPIELEHDFDSIDFDVALLSYLNSATIEYEYLLEGLNKNWINTGNDDKFSLRNLDDGKYNFKVRGRSNYGNWSEFEQFSFIVKTPPWKSIWAYGLYFSFIMAVIFWLLYLYKRKILYEHEISKQQNQKQIANAASKAKSDFLARVSHEIRTPLNGVLGMGELMLDTCMDEEQKVYADSIMASGHHLLDIINDILDLSKIEAGKLELEYKSFDLLLLVDEIVGVFTSQSKQKNLLFTCVFDEKINRYRIGDIIRIKQILFNLLSNAFKFTNQGEVSLHVSQLEDDNNTIIFSVVDTGSGIDDEFVEELFQPFVQADSAITRKFGGTGLGLAIVKQLVEKMQGKITAKKRCHKGSVFQAQIYLQIDDKIKPKDFEKNSYNVCLLIKQPNLKINLESYLNILNIKHTETLSAETTCVFVEALTQINSEYVSELSKLGQSNIMINFIGFNSDHIDKSLLKTNNLTRVLYPPITFKKIKKIYFDSKALEYKKQDNESVIITSTGLNLLVVEDNVVNQQVSIEMLEKMGHLVDIVDNAEEALIMLNRNKYDMLLLDYHLPMMDGLSLIKVWENKRNIPVIMITADLTDDVMQKCLKLNIDNIVPKPFTQLHLASAIEKGLSQTT